MHHGVFSEWEKVKKGENFVEFFDKKCMLFKFLMREITIYFLFF